MRAESRQLTPPRGRPSAPPNCGFKASRMAFSAGGPAAWDPLPVGFNLGAGPTIAHAQGAVSRRDEDVALLLAARHGDTDEVIRSLARASSPNVACIISSGGNATHGHATTALHVAAARGELSCVQVLLAGGADPRRRQSGLRFVTPLHEAATAAVAEELLRAGASPAANDPREPDPAWYHRQRGRHDVADCIVAARQAAAVSLPPPAPGAAGQAGAGSRKAYPCLSNAECAAVRKAWGISGFELRAAWRAADTGGGAPPDVGELAVAPPVESEELECAICMCELQDGDQCVLLPCGGGANLLDRPLVAAPRPGASSGSNGLSSREALRRQAAAAPASGGGVDSPGGGGSSSSGSRQRAPLMRGASSPPSLVRPLRRLSSNVGSGDGPQELQPLARRSASSAGEQTLCGKTPHAFHATCLERWWSRSCRCPTCRRDVRGRLAKAAEALSAAAAAASTAQRQQRASLSRGSSAPMTAVEAPAAHPAAAPPGSAGSTPTRKRPAIVCGALALVGEGVSLSSLAACTSNPGLPGGSYGSRYQGHGQAQGPSHSLGQGPPPPAAAA